MIYLFKRADNSYISNNPNNMTNNSNITSLTPAKAADLVGVEVPTIRRWCEWHKITCRQRLHRLPVACASLPT